MRGKIIMSHNKRCNNYVMIKDLPFKILISWHKLETVLSYTMGMQSYKTEEDPQCLL